MILRKKHSTLVLLFFLFLVKGFSQEFKSDEDRRKHAEKLFEDGKYIEAAPHFLHFLSLDQRNHEFNYKYGACLVFFGKDKTEPLKYLQYAVKDQNIDALAHYFLAKTYQQSFRFGAAIREYEIYKVYSGFKNMEKYHISNEIRACNNGKELLKNFSEIIVISKKNVKIDKFQYSYDLESIGGKILITDQFQSKIDKKKGHKAVVYFPKNNNQYIYYSSYGADAETGKDLYRVKRLDGGKFSSAEKLPVNINTEYDEDYAFLHPDGKTFYFSSKGHNSMGGYDIFKCEYDAAYNTYSEPVNLDFKINTPANDFLYIVDESGKFAHFSSDRASQGGEVDVYHIRNKTIPYSNVYIVGEFINDIGENLSISIKVEDASNKSIVGIYESKPQTGAYMVKLPRKGQFNYYVELTGDSKVYTGSINVPSNSSMMLKQEILLEKIGGNEELIIKNLFDEEIPNSEELMANMFIEISNLKENSDRFDESMLDDELSEDLMAQFGVDIATATEQELLNVVEEILERTEKSTSSKKQLIENAYMVAEDKTRESKLYKDQSDKLSDMIASEADPVKKEELIKRVKEAKKQQSIFTQQALFAVNYAKDLESKLKQSEKNIEKIEQLASQVQENIISQDKEAAVQTLRSMQQLAKNEEVTVNDESSASKVIDDQASLANEELKNKRSKYEKTKQNELNIKEEINALERRKVDAKKSEQGLIQLQIDDANETLEVNKKQVVKHQEAFAQAEEKYNIVKESQSKIKSVVNEITTGELAAKKHSTTEKQDIEIEVKQLAGEDVTELVANRTDEEVTTESISNVTVDKEAYARLEKEYEETFVIKDDQEKINTQKSVNKSYVSQLTNDISKLENELPNSSNKDEIESEIKDLYQLKKDKEVEIKKQNDKLYKLADIEASKSISTDKYKLLDSKYEVTSSAKKLDKGILDSLNGINEDFINLSNSDIAGLNEKLINSKDPIEQEVIKKAIDVVENKKSLKEAEKLRLISDKSILVEMSDAFSNEKFTAINKDIQAKKSSLTPVEDNLNLAQKGIELINSDVELINSKLSVVQSEEAKSILNNRKRALEKQQNQYESVVDKANELLAQQKEDPETKIEEKSVEVAEGEIVETKIDEEVAEVKVEEVKTEESNIDTPEVDKFDEKVQQNKTKYNSIDKEIVNASSSNEKIALRNNYISALKDEKLELNKNLSLSTDEVEKDRIRKRLAEISDVEDNQKSQIVQEKEERSIEATNQLLSETKNDSKYQSNIESINTIDNKTFNNEEEKQFEKRDAQKKYLTKVEKDVNDLKKNSNSISNQEIKALAEKEIARLEQKKQDLKREINEIEESISDKSKTQFALAEKVEYQNTDSKQKYDETTSQRVEVIQLKEKENALKQQSSENPDDVKVKKELIKTIENRIASENELIDSYQDVNQDEIKQLQDEISIIKQALIDRDASEEELSRIEDIEVKAKGLSQEAATLRYQTGITQDEELKNIKLNRAYTAEVESIKQLSKAKDSYETLAEDIDVNTKQLQLGKELSENNTDVSIVAKNSEFKSEEAQASFNKNQTVIEEIKEIEEEIDQILVNDFLTTEETKNLDKLEEKKTKKEIKLSQGLSEANKIEYAQNDNNQITIKQDLNDFEINSELSEYKKETENEEELIGRLFEEANEIRTVAEKTDDLELSKQLHKQANIKERIAILKQEDVIESYGEILTQNLLIEKETAQIEANHNLSDKQFNKAYKLEKEAEEITDNISATKDSLNGLGLDEVEISRRVNQIEKQAEIKTDLAEKLRVNASEIKEEELKQIEMARVVDQLSETKIESVKSESVYKKHYYLSEQKSGQTDELKELSITLAKEEINQQKLINKGEQFEFEANVTSNSDMKNELLQKAGDTKENAQLSGNRIDSLKAVIQSLKGNIASTESQITSNLTAVENSEELRAVYSKVENNKPVNKVEEVAVVVKEEIAEETIVKTEEVSVQEEEIIEEKVEERVEETIVEEKTQQVDYSKPIDVKTFVVPEKIDQPIFSKTVDNKSSYSDDTPMPINATPPEGLVFRVQIGAFVKPVSNDAFKGFTPISGEKIPGSKWVRYMAGYFTNFDLADDAKGQIRQIKGYNDAFVVAFYNGERISITKAKKIYLEGDTEQLADKNELEIPEVEVEEIIEKEVDVINEETPLIEEETTTNIEESSETKTEVVSVDEETKLTKVVTVTQIDEGAGDGESSQDEVAEKLKTGEPVNFNDLQGANVKTLNVQRTVEQTTAGILVTLVIENLADGGFAKVEEVIPAGFTVEPLTKSSALYKQDGDTIQFMWEDFTDEKTEIRYAIYPPDNLGNGVYKVFGTFVPEFKKEIKTFTYFRYSVSNVAQANPVLEITEKKQDEENSVVETQEETKVEESAEELTLEEVTNIDLNPEKAAYYSDADNAAAAEQVEVIKGLFFTVQIGVYSKPVPSSSLFNIKPLNTELIRSGLIRYTTGQFGSVEDASARKDEIRLIGVQDAFVTAYFNGERVTIAKAKEVLNKYGAEILVK